MMCIFVVLLCFIFNQFVLQRLESYYKRNYKDYFELMEGTLKAKNGELSDTEKGILDWLQSNK